MTFEEPRDNGMKTVVGLVVKSAWWPGAAQRLDSSLWSSKDRVPYTKKKILSNAILIHTVLTLIYTRGFDYIV